VTSNRVFHYRKCNNGAMKRAEGMRSWYDLASERPDSAKIPNGWSATRGVPDTSPIRSGSRLSTTGRGCVGKVTVEQVPRLLDGASELMVLSNSSDVKGLLVFGLDLKGRLDVEALRTSLHAAIQYFPQFLSTLTETRDLGRYRLMWVVQPEVHVELCYSELEISDSSVSIQNQLLRHLAGSLEKEWDLLHGPAAEFHLIRHAGEHHSFFILVHHAAADGWTILRFLKALMASYHEIVTGQSPHWATEAAYTSALKKQVVSLERRKWRDWAVIGRNIVDSAFRRPSLPERQGYSQSLGAHYAKWVFTVEETKEILKNLSGGRVSFVDLIVGGVAVAVDRWKAAMNQASGTLKICVTVQMRGRYGDLNVPMNSSPIFLNFRPSERSDRASLVRLAAEKRLEQSKNLADVTHFHVADTFTDVLRRLALSPRKRIIRSVCRMPIAPMLVASWGILWPEIRDGRPTKNSYLTQAGGLELTEVHALAYKPWFWCPLRVGVHTFRNRINLQLVAADRHFSPEQAESFLSLTAKTLLEDSFQRIPSS